MAYHVTSQTRRESWWEKENINESHVLYVVLYIKKSASWIYYENFKFQFLGEAFLII